MTHTYNVNGMSCNGCRSTVEKTLNQIEGLSAEVTLNPPVATITMQHHIATEKLQTELSKAGNYAIEDSDNSEMNHHHEMKEAESANISANSTGKFYCPMHCEGEKMYDKAGDCPVCGMHLVQEQTVAPKAPYTCPMHPEIIRDAPGSCPICGMNLILTIPTVSEEGKVYDDLWKKMKIAILFTVPVFLIAMISMITNSPLMKMMDMQKWNYVQFILTLPVVFYACWMFFVRAWKSIITWNLNMFTLVGIGTGVAFLFSIVGMLFPDLFPSEFKSMDGTVSLYFEATAVILTLVLLGQLLEAKAHSQTSGAIRELLKLAPTEATLVKDGNDSIISIHDIKKGDLLRVKPGDKIPVDGKISEGESIIDESMITGEPIPVDKILGDSVSSGTINGNKSFVMIAEKVGAETLLSQIVQMVNNASRSKAPIQKLADNIAKYFVPIVVIISIISTRLKIVYVIFINFVPWDESILQY